MTLVSLALRAPSGQRDVSCPFMLFPGVVPPNAQKSAELGRIVSRGVRSYRPDSHTMYRQKGARHVENIFQKLWIRGRTELQHMIMEASEAL
jgi:Holliday junction resolvase RusA-like endonuclease